MSVPIFFWWKRIGLLAVLGILVACNTPPSNALIVNENPFNKSYPGASATGAKFIFDVNGYCPDLNSMELMATVAVRAKGVCEHGFVMGIPNYSPPSCRVGVHCK